MMHPSGIYIHVRWITTLKMVHFINNFKNGALNKASFLCMQTCSLCFKMFYFILIRSLGEPVCVCILVAIWQTFVEVLTVGTQFPVYSTVSGRNLAGDWATWSTSLRALWLGRTELWGSHRARPVTASIWQLPHSPEGPIYEGVSGICHNERKNKFNVKMYT